MPILVSVRCQALMKNKVFMFKKSNITGSMNYFKIIYSYVYI